MCLKRRKVFLSQGAFRNVGQTLRVGRRPSRGQFEIGHLGSQSLLKDYNDFSFPPGQ